MLRVQQFLSAATKISRANKDKSLFFPANKKSLDYFPWTSSLWSEGRGGDGKSAPDDSISHKHARRSTDMRASL